MLQKELMDVLMTSVHDSSFREELLRDHRAALKSRGWVLTPEHQKKLDDFMAGDQVAGAATILQAFSDVARGTCPPPPPPWSPSNPIVDEAV